MFEDFVTKLKKTHLMQIILIVMLIGGGIFAAILLIKFRPEPQRVNPPVLAPLVKTEVLRQTDIAMVISGYGTVRAKVNVEIAPQVSGNVVWMHSEFTAGGFIPANTEFLRIDPRDYELAVEQAQAAVAEAMVNLDLEKAEAEVARKEWEQLNPGTEPASALVFREPQIRQAEAKLASAKAGLEVAKLNLERTSLTLPIDARIVSESVDLGQFVNAAKAIGTAYGTQAVEIELPLEDYELEWFDVPGDAFSFNGEKGTRATEAEVIVEFAGGTHRWKGYVTRTTGRVDETSRLVYVVVEVAEPFYSADGKPPLLPGSFVEVRIKGKTLEDAFAIDRDAIHNRNQIWIANGKKVDIRSLDIVRFDRDYAYVKSGLNDSDIIITSSLDAVTEGMAVRFVDEGQEPLVAAEADNNAPASTEID